ncbi:hypothetical protein POJ06DRAFT_20404 [Lipomyces tetrasporus]|uniref:Protein kinase domain-containing protein n=1 Tax=Lipomyces tetrasporus TaxID=54092 RepID=A0AAD7QMD4_9ASCO|nr:uncharacterized protein POJ06DRAFT_20404 [Lipomyces tetrasporus]KAJ8097728.1 hypothetical protein POJ06DRAFT_20404 [Lipomyces tetrasporus]
MLRFHISRPVITKILDRQVIMKAVVEAESLLYTHNVLHRDIHPRNILVLSAATATYDRRVVVVDLGDADIGRSPRPKDPEAEARYLPGVPISPLLRWNVAWWRHRQSFFSTWIDWDWQSWLEHNYGFIDRTMEDMKSNTAAFPSHRTSTSASNL